MDYNERLLELEKEKERIIKEAEKEGYIKVNGRLIKKHYVPVIEFLIYTETLYEEEGRYKIAKGTFIIDEDTFGVMKSVEDEEEFWECIINYCEDYLPNNFYDILDDFGNYDLEKISQMITEDEAIDFYWQLEENRNLFSNEVYFNCDRGRGFISIYKMPINEYKRKNDEVFIKMDKYLRPY